MYSPILRHEIIALYKLGNSQAKISNIVGVPKSTVQYIIKKYTKTKCISRICESDAKKRLSDENLSFILDQIKSSPGTTAVELSKELATCQDLRVTPQTVRNYLHLADLHSRSPCYKPLISQKNKKIRFDICEQWFNFTKKFWGTVLFSDECKFEVWSTSRSSRIWRKDRSKYDEKNLSPTVKYGGSLMVWGCMGRNGVGKLVFIDGTMDSIVYVRILSENLNESAEKLGLTSFTFQQDNDPSILQGIQRLTLGSTT